MRSYSELMKGKDHVEWDYYDKFNDIIDTYLPTRGQGETLATQICTAVNKLVYKWYNDGDVFDNTHGLEGWWNDLSSYANWLYKYVPKSQDILDRIETINHESEYEFLLKDLADAFLKESVLKGFNEFESMGDIYECDGKFHFNDSYDEDDEDEEM
ncbi:MAG: hypothetical protein NC087_05255 [Anaeroplasma bactoclasticum]|nr:hypothetical protein [Anaeroplasma bactoclasticum]